MKIKLSLLPYLFLSTLNISYASDFIVSPHHNDLMPTLLREGLVAKGYDTLLKINQGLALADMDHKIEFFPDSAQGFTRMYTMTLHPPTLTNISRKVQKLTSFETSPSPRLQRQAALESLIAVYWALSDFASGAGDSCISCSFSIVDPHSYLFNFFSHYAKLATAKDIFSLPYGPTNAFNPYGEVFAYNRHPHLPMGGSSHYINLTEYQIGIDTRFQSSAYPIEVLPYRKTHMLVGRIQSEIGLPSKTFLKAEYYGLGDIASTVMHTKQLLAPTLSEKLVKRTEKIIPEPLIAAFMPLAERVKEVGFEYALWMPKESLRNLLLAIVMMPDGGKLPPFSLATITAFTYLVYREAEDTIAKELSLNFFKALEATYHDGILNQEGTLSTALSRKHKSFHRHGNEYVFYLDEIKGA